MTTQTTRFAAIDPSEWPDTGLYCRLHPHVQMQGALVPLSERRGVGSIWLIYCSACRETVVFGHPPSALSNWAHIAVLPDGWTPAHDAPVFARRPRTHMEGDDDDAELLHQDPPHLCLLWPQARPRAATGLQPLPCVPAPGSGPVEPRRACERGQEEGQKRMKKRKLRMVPDTTPLCELCGKRLRSIAHSGENGGKRCMACHCAATADK